MNWDKNNPWGKPSNEGNGKQKKTVSIDDFVNENRRKLNSFFSGGGESNKYLFLIIGAILLLWLGSGFYRVGEQEEAVVLRFGKPMTNADGEYIIVGPGLRYHFPNPIETVNKVDVRQIRNIEIGQDQQSLILTGDQNIISAMVTVQWYIENLPFFLFNSKDPEKTLEKITESALREVIAQVNMDFAMTFGRDIIRSKVIDKIRSTIGDYKLGIAVKEVQLKDVFLPDEGVRQAFLEVTNAKAEAVRIKNIAIAHRNKVINEVEGQADKLVKEAEAYKEQKIKLAEGDAEKFLKMEKIFRESPDVLAKEMWLGRMGNVLQHNNIIVHERNNPVFPHLAIPQIAEKLDTRKVGG